MLSRPLLDFNPRAYVRHDLSPMKQIRRSSHFNPRAYVRHDPRRRDLIIEARISIHVPT